MADKVEGGAANGGGAGGGEQGGNTGAGAGNVDTGAAKAGGASLLDDDFDTEDTSGGNDGGDGGAGKGAGKEAAGSGEGWGDDWRQRIAGDDEKTLKRLQRMSSPTDLYKSLTNLEKKLSSGQYKRTTPPEDNSPEAIAAWRKEMGLPETPDKFGLKFRDGFVPAETDKPVLDEFRQYAFEKNLTPDAASAAAQWFFDKQEAIAAQILEQDYTAKAEAEEALRQDFRNEYKLNMSVTKSWMANTFGVDIASELLNARGPSGRTLGNNPDFVRAIVRLAREAEPGANLVPAGGESVTKSIETELDAIGKLRREDPDKYWGDNKLLARERDLIAAQEKASQRGKAA